jgi:voltage-gated potassium channel
MRPLFTIFVDSIMIALPVGIIASASSDEVNRRDFVVAGNRVAGGPWSAGLQAGDIADIMPLLRTQQMEPEAIMGGAGG